jgi:hypothetical protein
MSDFLRLASIIHRKNAEKSKRNLRIGLANVPATDVADNDRIIPPVG